MTLHLTNVHVTVGDAGTAGVNFTSTGGTIDVAALQAPAAAGNAQWIAAEGSISGITFHGSAAVTLTLTDLNVELNVARGGVNFGSGTTSAAPLDWTQALNLNGNTTFGEAGPAPSGDQLLVGTTPIDLTQGVTEASGTGNLRIFDFVNGEVSFVFKQQTSNLDANGDGTIDPGFVPTSPPARGPPDLANAIVTSLGLTVSGAGIAIGVPNGPGFTVTSGTLALAIVTPSAADRIGGDERMWFTLESSIADATLTGIDGFSAYGSDLQVELNKATGSYTTGGHDIGADALKWGTALSIGALTVNSIALNLSTELLHLRGTLGVDIGSGFVVAAGTFDLTTLTIATGTYAGDDAAKLTITGGSLFVGTGGSLTGLHHDTVTHASGAVGVSVAGVDLTVAAMTVGAARYTGLEITGGSVTLVGFDSALTLSISDVHVVVNDAVSGSRIDWATVDGLGFALGAATSFSAAAAITANLASGTVLLSGSASFTRFTGDQGVLTGVDILAVSVSNGRVFAGAGATLNADGTINIAGANGFYADGFGFDYVSATSGGTTYTGLHLSAATVSVVGFGGLGLDVANLYVDINRAVGGRQGRLGCADRLAGHPRRYGG